MKNLIPLMYLLVCLVGCTATKVEHKPNAGGGIGAPKVDKAHEKATTEYWMSVRGINTELQNIGKSKGQQMQIINTKMGSVWTLREALRELKALTAEVAKADQVGVIKCMSLPTRNVDPEALETGEALMAVLGAEYNSLKLISKMDLMKMVFEAGNIEAANGFDTVFNFISQKIQALQGKSPPVKNPTPWSDQYNEENSTKGEIKRARKEWELRVAHFAEIEMQSRHVLSQRYNVDFPPLFGL